jgi:PadR family transcriptional regulator PadR
LLVNARKRKISIRLDTCLYLELQCIMSSVTRRDTNPNFMNGVPELLILRLLQQQEMYGYEIVQAIRERTGSVVTIGEGVVYPVLHGLEQDGALKSRRKSVNGRSRIYYSLTKRGARRLSDLAEDWSKLTVAVRMVLAGGQYGEAIP